MSTLISAEQARRNQRALRLKAYLTHKGQPRDLAAPEVPQALAPDNLLPKEVLLSGLQVLIQEWERPLPLDTLYIYWNDAEIHKVTIEEIEKFPYTLTIKPEQLISDGTFPLNYKVIADSGTSSESAVVNIKIDHTPPNQNNVPPALVFDAQVISEGLTLEYLAANGDQVIATVPEYVQMQAGEVVHAFWAEIPLTPVTLTDTEVAAKKVPVVITGDVVRQAGEGSQIADYYLTSRAGFDGLPSVAIDINVLLTPTPSGLKAPKVPLAEDDAGIDLQDANMGVVVQIEKYQNAGATDLVVAQWGTTKLSPALVFPEDFPILVSVPRSTVIAEGSGQVEVSYVVSRAGLNFDSPPITVKVDIETVGPIDPDPSTPENEALKPPTLLSSTQHTNELTPEDLGQDATVQVPFYKEAKAEDLVTLYWGAPPGKLAGSFAVTAEQVTAQVFEPSKLLATTISGTPDDPAWPLYYSLSLPDKPGNAVSSPAASINIHMSTPGGPGGLLAATFPDASENGWLLPEQVENGANLLVAVYENMKAGDIVTLDWLAFSSTNAAEGTDISETQFNTSKTVGQPELAAGVSFIVPYEFIQPIAEVSPTQQGSGRAVYTVTQGGTETAAPQAIVKIELGHP
ncbi:hypothetical protein [Pseudomonas sp. 5P_3.1_Bac2]|uniref:hypothetical protein n=1 Tax=Pseudomonas sp. 5P_3.1_Bac2 TaxID=2971617 RepID=UPI0021C8DBC3|nr:hypothetical protein [Pseudomonas sp. 5P_3.1_Bac2]MCU1719011.1 hypothetical protein [Pseudomonas sp. 5P_3.1_Bac2]